MNNLIKLFPLALGGLILFGSGCVTREDIRGIQMDLYAIQKGLDDRLGTVKDQTESVQTTQADIRLDVEDLSENLTALRVELQDSRRRMEQLSVRLDDLEASLNARMDAQIELLSGSKFVAQPLPSTVYNLANTDFVRGRYSQSIKGFNNYIKQFPKGEKVPEAYLKIGDAHSKLGEWPKAAESYDQLIKGNVSHRLVPTALLRKGKALEEQGKYSSAKEIYKNITKGYPYRPETRTARERLNTLQNEKEQ